MIKTWLSVLLFFYFGLLSAQEGFLRHYSISDGLPSSETYSSFQDSKGYIWISSDMGISRFDGYNFKVFTTADGLTDNTVFKFLEDHSGRIWFHTFSGRLSYYYHDSIYGKDFSVNESIRNFLGSGFINNMNVDAGDTVWLATPKGLIKISPSWQNGQRKWEKIEFVNHAFCYLIPSGYLTCQPSTGNSSMLVRYRHQQVDSVIFPYPFSSIAGIFNLAHDSSIMMFNADMVMVDSLAHLTAYKVSNTPIGCLQESDSTIWISKKHSGVQLFKSNDLQNPQLTLLKSLSVTDILKDKEGGYWFTTLEDGVFYMPGKQFKYFNPDEKKWDYNQCLLTTIGKNRIWLLAVNGLLEPSEIDQLKPVQLDKILPQHNFRYLNAFCHSDGQVWISANFGIAVIDQSKHSLVKLISLFAPDKSIADSRVLIEDKRHDVWSLNHSFLFKIDYKTKQVVKTLPVPSRAETICQDENGQILIGTVNGLYSLSGDSFLFWGNRNSVFKNRFVDIKNSGDITVGATRGAGLVILKGDSIYRVSAVNGLRSNMCRSVFIDAQNVIWVGTNNGLSSVKISTHPFATTIHNFTVSDGLPSNDIENVVRVSGWVWTLTKRGIAAFNPETVMLNNYPPPVYITRLKIDNTFRSITTDTVLSHSTNFIGIDFVGLTYKNAGKQTYKYILQGYDTAWTYTGNTFVQFTKLPPGSYRFIVLCVNNAGIESTTPAVYSFTITTPFYRTWWFTVLLFIFSLTAIIVIAALNVARIRRREENKTELNRKIANLELQALRAQMNPHFIFNCLNAIQDFILKNDSAAAKHYLSSFSKLIRKTLDNSRRQTIRLQDEIDFLNLYLELESMRFVDKFNYHINLEEGLENKYIQIPSMILQPFIENAVRHSRIGSLSTQGELNITFTTEGNRLVCVIDDNGIGLNQSLKLKGEQPAMREAHALDIISERIGSMNEVHHSNISYTIIDKSDLGNGTTGTLVEIQIPLE